MSPAEELERLAAPWSTRAQLEKLSAQPRASADTVEFAVLGDAEPCRFTLLRLLFNRPEAFPRQVREIQRRPVEFSVQLGDMVSRGLPRYYDAFLRELAGLDIRRPYLTVCGNHDRSRPNGKSHSTLYRRLFGRANYHFDRGPARFIVLDSSAKRVSRAQLRWLKKVLDTPLRALVFTHMPPVPLGLWGGGAAHEFGGFTRGAREFMDLMSERRVERVYMGHVHAFGVQDWGGVRYVLTGGGGSALFPSGSADRFHHYLTVSVGPDGVSERVHPLDGVPFAVPAGKVILGEKLDDPLPALTEALTRARGLSARLRERQAWAAPDPAA